MKRFPYKVAVAIVAVVVAAATLIPRSTLDQILQSISASAGRSTFAQVVITLEVPDDRPFVYKVNIDRSDVSRIKSNPEQVQRCDYVVDAKKNLAEKRGYHRDSMGGNTDRVMNGVRLQSVEIEYPTGGKVDSVYQRRVLGHNGSHAYLD